MAQFREYLTAKLHRITVTHAEKDYVGSVAIDAFFMERAGIRENEKVEVVNITTGTRWTTYAIPAHRGSRTMSLNGGGARLGAVSDKLVVMTFAISDAPLLPKILFFDDTNEIIGEKTKEAHGMLHPDLIGTPR